MAYHPNDLVADTDLVAYERTILEQFGADEWQAKRQKAIEDWLFPLLASSGLDPYRLRTRAVPGQVWGVTSGVYTDYTAKAQAQTPDQIPLSSILASANDALVIGAPWQFRGVSLRMLEAVSTIAASLTVEVWRDQWVSVAAIDETVSTEGIPFSKGGTITWPVPEDWVTRPVNNSGHLYFARIRLSAAPTGASLGQVSVIRRSALCAAVTFRTLCQIFREAPTQQDGPFQAKADWYEKQAEDAWQRVLPLLGHEIDNDPVDDVIGLTEANQTTARASGGGWTLERS
jgi:hypothetical protein